MQPTISDLHEPLVPEMNCQQMKTFCTLSRKHLQICHDLFSGVEGYERHMSNICDTQDTDREVRKLIPDGNDGWSRAPLRILNSTSISNITFHQLNECGVPSYVTAMLIKHDIESPRHLIGIFMVNNNNRDRFVHVLHNEYKISMIYARLLSLIIDNYCKANDL
jgi:hypothetical protein